jgi:hypothetical protein
MITSLPISDAKVTITLPDGSTESNSTAADGTTVFQQLPISSYKYETEGNLLLQATGNATISQEGSVKLGIGVFYVPSLAALVASAFVVVIALMSLIRRRRHPPGNELRRNGVKRTRERSANDLDYGATETYDE